jgi:hypothetical protein
VQTQCQTDIASKLRAPAAPKRPDLSNLPLTSSALGSLRLIPPGAQDVNLPQDVFFLSSFLGGRQLGLQSPQFLFAMVASFQFSFSFDHVSFPSFVD